MTPEVKVDVIVLGTGAAGLPAAVRAARSGADVGLFDKADTVAATTATTAWSRVTVCVGLNPHETEQGLEDDRRDALDETLIEAYVNTVSELVTWREANTPVVFETCST